MPNKTETVEAQRQPTVMDCSAGADIIGKSPGNMVYINMDHYSSVKSV